MVAKGFHKQRLQAIANGIMDTWTHCASINSICPPDEVPWEMYACSEKGWQDWWLHGNLLDKVTGFLGNNWTSFVAAQKIDGQGLWLLKKYPGYVARPLRKRWINILLVDF